MNATQWWDLVPAVVGGLIGALAGGVPSYLLARRTTKETLERDQEERRQRDLAVGYQVFVKLGEIVNGIMSLNAQLNKMLDDANVQSRGRWELWQKVVPMLGFDDHPSPRFTAEEAALFIAAKRGDYANNLLLIDKRYPALLASLRDYSRRREKLSSLLPTTKITGQIGESTLTPAQAAQVLPLAAALNVAAEAILAHLADDRVLAMKLANDFGPILRTHLKNPEFPRFEMDPEELIG